RRSILWDLNYFKYCFLKATGLEFQEDKLEDEFEHMAEILMRSASATFLYRDFQSRNVMIKDGEPYFIDFQGGRKGPFYYDVASFLWQAKANLPDSLRMELVSHYIDALREYKPVDETYFKSQLRHFVLFRTLQVLGAYGFRGYFEKKPHFIQSVPFAVENLRQLLKDDFPEYPYLCEMLRNLTELKQFTDERKKRQLTVKVMSFAYKKGIPEDPTGNGGGYVFDCRAVNNPGKYDRYKPYTGLDENVIRFLEEDGEITRFLEHVYALVDAHVQRYIERGFTNLSVCFGCTGGQHRSVYSAQHVAEHISRKFGVKVQLIHREQNIEQIFEAR
ncbi:RapZ C-terminal domain-containing protein, partial [Phocaeicola barnesiae]|uniref:RapZ C-terminal domain-containing protein n=1 Tax=Phocaeicola barnesiae TaxID=376804 RepID=UPI00241EAAE9